MGLSTHVLDLVTGAPVADLQVRLMKGSQVLRSAQTDEDGRCKDLLGDTPLETATYTIMFDAGAYFAGKALETFYQVIPITFNVSDTDRHYHVPLLLSPFGYSTYRGS